LKQRLLIIPAEAYKTDHVHVIPLVPEAVAILKNIPKSSKPIRGIGKFYRTRLPARNHRVHRVGVLKAFHLSRSAAHGSDATR